MLNGMEIPGVTQDEADAWVMVTPRGARPLVQDAFPNCTADEREFILSGIPPEKWERYLG
jgi:hypothetical protein